MNASSLTTGQVFSYFCFVFASVCDQSFVECLKNAQFVRGSVRTQDMASEACMLSVILYWIEYALVLLSTLLGSSDVFIQSLSIDNDIHNHAYPWVHERISDLFSIQNVDCLCVCVLLVRSICCSSPFHNGRLRERVTCHVRAIHTHTGRECCGTTLDTYDRKLTSSTVSQAQLILFNRIRAKLIQCRRFLLFLILCKWEWRHGNDAGGCCIQYRVYTLYRYMECWDISHHHHRHHTKRLLLILLSNARIELWN